MSASSDAALTPSPSLLLCGRRRSFGPPTPHPSPRPFLFVPPSARSFPLPLSDRTVPTSSFSTSKRICQTSQPFCFARPEWGKKGRKGIARWLARRGTDDARDCRNSCKRRTSKQDRGGGRSRDRSGSSKRMMHALKSARGSTSTMDERSLPALSAPAAHRTASPQPLSPVFRTVGLRSMPDPPASPASHPIPVAAYT